MKVHIQKKHKSKNLQLDHLSQRNEQAHVNKRPVGPGWDLRRRVWEALGSTPVRDSGFFLSVMLVISHDIIIFRDLTNLQWRHQQQPERCLREKNNTLRSPAFL